MARRIRSRIRALAKRPMGALVEARKFSLDDFEGLYRIAAVRCCKDLLLGRGLEAL
jgi:hypothetical protein